MQYAQPKHGRKMLAKVNLKSQLKIGCWKTASHVQFNSLNTVKPIPLSGTQCVVAYIVLAIRYLHTKRKVPVLNNPGCNN